MFASNDNTRTAERRSLLVSNESTTDFATDFFADFTRDIAVFFISLMVTQLQNVFKQQSARSALEFQVARYELTSTWPLESSLHQKCLGLFGSRNHQHHLDR